MVNLAVRIAWAGLVGFSMVLMIRGLAETGYFEPTEEALAADRQGEILVAVGACLLIGLAAFAYFRMAARRVVPATIVAAAAIGAGVTLTDAFAILVVPLILPLAFVGALFGVVGRPRVK